MTSKAPRSLTNFLSPLGEKAYVPCKRRTIIIYIEAHLLSIRSSILHVQVVVAQYCRSNELSGGPDLNAYDQTIPVGYSSLEPSRRQELRTAIEQLRGTRAAVRRMNMELTQRRSLPLPFELLGMIFDYYAHLYGQLPEKLLLVCRTWHVVALSQRMLWTDLDPLGPFDLRVVRPWAGTFLQSRIARSNPVPLTVNFTRWRTDMTSSVVKKVAAIPTFLPRIQALVISRALDITFLTGHQPLLNSLTIVRSSYPRESLIANLVGKTLTTLHLSYVQIPLNLPDSLLRELQTLELAMDENPEGVRECWAMIQKSTTLRTLHIHPTYGNAPALFHPSVRHLSIVYPSPRYKSQTSVYSLEEVRMPRLQDITIDTPHPKALMQLELIETPLTSLHLKCRPHPWEVDPAVDISSVDGAVHVLRSTSRLEKLEISAPCDLVSGLLEALERDSSLCTALNVFIVNDPTGMEKLKGARKRNIEARFDQLRGKVVAYMDKRQSSMSAH